MRRLILASVKHDKRLWAGPFVAALVMSFVTAFYVAVWQASGDFKPLEGVAPSLATIVVVTGAIVLSSVVDLAVSAQQRELALWQLAGVRPGLVGYAIVGQIVVVTAVASTIGALLLAVLIQPLFDFVFSYSFMSSSTAGMTFEPEVPPITYVFGGPVLVVLLCCLIAVIAGLRGARTASTVPPLAVLRDGDPSPRTMGVLRWLMAGVFGAGALGVIVVGRSPLDYLVVSSFGVGVLTSLSPLYLAPLLKAWTAVVPNGASPVWFLARRRAHFALSLTAAAITPLAVAIAFAISVFTASNMYSLIPIPALLLLLTGPLTIAVVGAAVVVFMSARRRERELALLLAAGGTSRRIIASSLAEAIIYAVTAAITALVASVLAWLIVVVPRTDEGAPVAALALTAGAIVAALGLVLIALSTTVPTVSALKGDVARTLADD